MARKEHHVIPHKKKWAVEKNNSERVSRTFSTKKEAEKWGREQSKTNHTELIIHKRDGTIQKADSHGNNPCPPEDKK
jgi:uncharacterized protein YdaT